MDSSQWRDVNEGLFGAHAGFELALAPALLGLVGFWLDTRFELTPLLSICFVLGGLIGAVASVYYRYRYAMEQAAAQRRDAEAELAAVERGTLR